MKEIRVGIVGATGYTALELARLLLQHPQASVVAATSRSDAGKRLSEIHPSLNGRCDVEITNLEAAEIASQCDVVMCCLPHGASAETVRDLVQSGVRVIDFSADFRLSRLEVYEEWYGVAHPWPERFGTAAYGMPEFFADQIRECGDRGQPRVLSNLGDLTVGAAGCRRPDRFGRYHHRQQERSERCGSQPKIGDAVLRDQRIDCRLFRRCPPPPT